MYVSRFAYRGICSRGDQTFKKGERKYNVFLNEVLYMITINLHAEVPLVNVIRRNCRNWCLAPILGITKYAN